MPSSQPSSDRELVARLATGDEAALARKVIAGYISYAFHRVGEVTDTITGIDLIMGFGFNWAPPSVLVDTFGTGKLADDKIAKLVEKHFDLRPKGIVQMLDLLRPIYEKTAAYGHFGREEPEFTWEGTDKALALKQAA